MLSLWLLPVVLALLVADQADANVTWSLRITDTPGAASATAAATVCVPDVFGPTAAAEATAAALREVATEFGIGPLVQQHRVRYVSPHGDVPVPRRLHIAAVSSALNSSCTRVEVLPGRWYATQRTVTAVQRACASTMMAAACASFAVAQSLHAAAPSAGRRGWLRSEVPAVPVPHIGTVDLAGAVRVPGRPVDVWSVLPVAETVAPTAHVTATVESLSEWAHILSINVAIDSSAFDSGTAMADAVAVLDVPLNALRFDKQPSQSVLCRWADGVPCANLAVAATVSAAATSAAWRVAVRVQFALRYGAGRATWVWRCPAQSPRLPAAAYPPDLNAAVLLPTVKLTVGVRTPLGPLEGPGGAVYTPGPDRAVPFITACLTGLVGSWGLIRISQLFTLMTSDATA